MTIKYTILLLLSCSFLAQGMQNNSNKMPQNITNTTQWIVLPSGEVLPQPQWITEPNNTFGFVEKPFNGPMQNPQYPIADRTNQESETALALNALYESEIKKRINENLVGEEVSTHCIPSLEPRFTDADGISRRLMNVKRSDKEPLIPTITFNYKKARKTDGQTQAKLSSEQKRAEKSVSKLNLPEKYTSAPGDIQQYLMKMPNRSNHDSPPPILVSTFNYKPKAPKRNVSGISTAQLYGEQKLGGKSPKPTIVRVINSEAPALPNMPKSLSEPAPTPISFFGTPVPASISLFDNDDLSNLDLEYQLFGGQISPDVSAPDLSNPYQEVFLDANIDSDKATYPVPLAPAAASVLNQRLFNELRADGIQQHAIQPMSTEIPSLPNRRPKKVLTRKTRSASFGEQKLDFKVNKKK